MAEFTPVNPTAWRLCQRCNVQFDSAIPLTYVRGKGGSGRMCCPGCARHYEQRKVIEEAQNSVPGANIDFTAAGVAGLVGQRELVKATSAAQRGGLQTLGTVGYTPNHAVHQLHRNKMALAASSGRVHQVMIHIALHHLKPEGKSGTELVGNIERDICVPLNITRAQLRSIVIDQLDPLWAEWSHNYSLSLYTLEMHKSPKMILYDPRRPSEDAHEPILQEFFLRSTAKDPVPKFHTNARVAILLIMTYTQFHDALSWQEGYSDRVANATNTSKVAPAFTSESTMPVAAPSKKHKKKLMHANGSSSPPPCPAKKRARMVHLSQSSSVKSLSVIVSEVSLAGAGDAHERTCASNADVSQLCLPSQSQVQEAMQAQGNVRKQALTINLIAIPFSITHRQHTIATLAVDTNASLMIGTAGSFKTCHPAMVTVTGPSGSSSLSILSATQLVAKRVFFWNNQVKGRRRFGREDELSKTLDEVNCLYWGGPWLGWHIRLLTRC
ncbi:hypothetical protein CY34DRAFT_111148 [Suillus luteus UH-Slu-Lm8-n1]|uniref:Uncharacterized protein n=1 Tax=Suillus luteus UH-Slu-Lm8-n1 TaxID=930992 RepID=A0A0D0AJA7_9AGAM|nr:hypothetical protein CY34DRAFT_111148 [Suillus luteus UH-Slu-Lm8-n1]